MKSASVVCAKMPEPNAVGVAGQGGGASGSGGGASRWGCGPHERIVELGKAASAIAEKSITVPRVFMGIGRLQRRRRSASSVPRRTRPHASKARGDAGAADPVGGGVRAFVDG